MSEKQMVFRSMDEFRHCFFPNSGGRKLTPEEQAKRSVDESRKRLVEKLRAKLNEPKEPTCDHRDSTEATLAAPDC